MRSIYRGSTLGAALTKASTTHSLTTLRNIASCAIKENLPADGSHYFKTRTNTYDQERSFTQT